MKRLWLFSILALTGGFFTSCGDDPIDQIFDDNFAPSLSLLTTNPTGNTGLFYSEDTTIGLENDGAIEFSVGLEGTDSTPTLKTLEVFLNDVKVDGSLVSITAADGTDIGNNNPALLISPFDTTFQFEVTLQTMEAFGVNTFRFLLTDSGNETSETSIIITTEEAIVIVETPLEGNLSGILLNQAGPAGQGGLDLDEGVSTGSANVIAEIKDNGIDSGPVATNWKRTISTVNGTNIRTVNAASLGENYNFDNVETIEEVQAAWSTGDAVTGNSTQVITVGDEFIVESADGSRYYLLQVVEVNLTNNNNADNYVFNIKY